jgi:hypothetical protein
MMRIYDSTVGAYREWQDGEQTNKSNWPDYGVINAKQRSTQFYAVDVDGVTVATSKNNKSALETARYYKRQGREVEVRFVHLEEADFQQADERRKQEFWEDFLYKPTPARIVRHHK